MTHDSDILRVENLAITFHTEDGEVPAVRDISFSVPRGKTVALLGESGCGKSVTARAVLNFIDHPGKLEEGSILLRKDDTWTDLLKLDPECEAIRRVRWKEISMIFQNPRNALTPAYTVGDQIIEAITLHEKVSYQQARRRAIDLLREVGIPGPERRLDDYPHQLSGGMCQRVMIAMALACRPRLIIADEPTTALDVTIQAQVLNLLKNMQLQYGTSILLITHDMGVVAEMADEVVVMYLGRVAERGRVTDIFDKPLHPYTRQLFASTPRPDLVRGEPLPSIPGAVPDHFSIPSGCPFRGRCAEEHSACSQQPTLIKAHKYHQVACWLHEPGVKA